MQAFLWNAQVKGNNDFVERWFGFSEALHSQSWLSPRKATFRICMQSNEWSKANRRLVQVPATKLLNTYSSLPLRAPRKQPVAALTPRHWRDGRGNLVQAHNLSGDQGSALDRAHGCGRNRLTPQICWPKAPEPSQIAGLDGAQP